VEALSVANDTAMSNPRWAGSSSVEPRWDLAFVGILGYFIVEYSRLPAMYPILVPLQLGKVMVGLSVLGLLLSPRHGDNTTRIRPIYIALASFFLAILLSIPLASFPGDAWDAIYDVFAVLISGLLLGRIVITPWRMRVAVFVYLVLNLKLAQFAVRGYLEGSSYRSAASLAAGGVGGGSTGFFGNSSDFGVAMCVVWPLAGALLFARIGKFARLCLLISFAAYFGAILLCGSRGAVVGAAAAAAAAFLKNPKRIVGLFLVAVVLAGSWYLLPEASKDRMRSGLKWEEDKTASQRITFWKAGLKMFSDHPVLGVGLANFPPSFATQYAPPEMIGQKWVPHNIVILALSELGLVGTVPLFILWILFFRLNSQTRKHLLACDPANRQSFEYCMALGLDFAFVGYFVSGCFVTVLYYPHFWVLLGLSVGLSRACARKALAGEANADPIQSRSHAWQTP